MRLWTTDEFRTRLSTLQFAATQTFNAYKVRMCGQLIRSQKTKNKQAVMATIDLQFTKICEGLEGSEGPVFDTKGNFYAVSPMDSRQEGDGTFRDGIAGRLHKIDVQSGEREAVCTPMIDNYGGRPAGCQSDKDGNIWIADMRLGILKYTPGGGCQQMSKTDTEGNPLNGCNDLVFDEQGNLWVTGPGSPIAPDAEDRTKIFREAVGCLYCLEKGATVPIKVPNQAFIFCNGIATKGGTLLVAETVTQSIIAFDIVSPGILANRRLWAKLPEAEYNNPMKLGGPDGMDFDIRGRLLVAHHGGGHLEVFSPDGELEGRIKCPFKTPSNLHFKQGSNMCCVTEHDFNGLWRFEWECEGMPMYCDERI